MARCRTPSSRMHQSWASLRSKIAWRARRRLPARLGRQVAVGRAEQDRAGVVLGLEQAGDDERARTQRRTVAWASMSATPGTSRTGAASGPSSGGPNRRVRAPLVSSSGTASRRGGKSSAVAAPRSDLADHVVRDVGPGGPGPSATGPPGSGRSAARRRHARGRPGSVGIVRHLTGILSGKADHVSQSAGIGTEPVST